MEPRARPAVRRAAAAGPSRRTADDGAAAVHWRSVRPTRAAVRTLLTTVLLCGLRSCIWDRRCGRSGVGSADIGGGPRVIWLGFFADDRRGRCPPCPTAARGGWAAKPNFGRTLRIDCWAAEGVGGWNRREIGFGVDWHRSPLLALRGAAVGGIRILLPNPSNHFQLSWTEKCTQERDRRKMVGRVGQVGHDSVSLDTPTPHRHISHDRVRRRGVGSRATGNRRSGRFYALRASVGHYRYTIHRVCTLLLGRGGLTLTPYPHPSQHRPSPSPLTLTLPRTDPHPHPSPSKQAGSVSQRGCTMRLAACTHAWPARADPGKGPADSANCIQRCQSSATANDQSSDQQPRVVRTVESSQRPAANRP